MSLPGRIVKVELPDGEEMYVEVESVARGDVARRGDDLRITYDDFKRQVSTVSKWVLESVREGLPEAPARVGVEFGLKLTAETGPLLAVLAKAGAEGSVVVRMEWDNTGKTATGADGRRADR